MWTRCVEIASQLLHVQLHHPNHVRAVKYAAAQAKLGEGFKVSEYPRAKQFPEAFTEALEGHRRDESFAGPTGVLVREATDQLKVLNRLNDPQGLYARLPFDLSLR